MNQLKLLIAGLAALSLVSCTAMTGKSAGRNVDDASITTAVKAKLATSHVTSLTRIGVDTDNGVVYLNGIVPTSAEKSEAARVADSVSGVRKVVNNLQIEPSGTSS